MILLFNKKRKSKTKHTHPLHYATSYITSSLEGQSRPREVQQSDQDVQAVWNNTSLLYKIKYIRMLCLQK